MLHMISAIVLNALGIYFGTSAYIVSNTTTAYIFGILSSIAYLIGFLFLEYALYQFDFGTVFTVWAGGIAVILTIIGVIFWNEPGSIWQTVFLGITVIGLEGLLFSQPKELNC